MKSEVGKDPQTPPESVLLQHWQVTIPLLTTTATEGQAPGGNAAVRQSTLPEGEVCGMDR